MINNNKKPKSLKLTYLLLGSVLAVTIVSSVNVHAKKYTMPSNGDVIGQVIKLSPNQLKPNDNFLTLSERYGVGFHELEEANPSASAWTPNYGDIIIPQQYVLPKVRKGIVINLAELRLYYFPEDSNSVYTYPVGIGKKDWATPTVRTSVVGKAKNPTWTVPDSIKTEYKERGEKIANSIPPGPDNPLGQYVLRLGAAGYLIHGTNAKVGVGLRVSHGCIRLFNKDIKELFYKVPKDTPVTIINEPYKIGHSGGKLYLEAHKPLSEDGDSFEYNQELIRARLDSSDRRYKINWDTTEYVADEQRGIPAPIGNI